jgi:hypothetical protein
MTRALLTKVLWRQEHLLRMLAFTFGARQCDQNWETMPGWYVVFRPVSSPCLESLFRFLTKGKCCCLVTVKCSVSLCVIQPDVFTAARFACNVNRNIVACSTLGRYVTTLISHLVSFSSFVIPYSSFGTQIRTLLGFELSPAYIPFTVTLILWF